MVEYICKTCKKVVVTLKDESAEGWSGTLAWHMIEQHQENVHPTATSKYFERVVKAD